MSISEQLKKHMEEHAAALVEEANRILNQVRTALGDDAVFGVGTAERLKAARSLMATANAIKATLK